MLKFFRSIRRKFLAEGSFRKYLAYALGEILLVVIGILIALQINNWNESRKLYDRQQFLLGELREDLTASQVSLELAIKRHGNISRHIDIIIDHIQGDSSYQASLGTSFFLMEKFSEPKISFTTYETLKAQGLDLIKSKALRDTIRYLYETVYVNLNEVNYALRSNYENSVVSFLTKHFRPIGPGGKKPNDFEALKQNVEFLNIVYTLKALQRYSTSKFQWAMGKTQQLIDLIDQELAIK